MIQVLYRTMIELSAAVERFLLLSAHGKFHGLEVRQASGRSQQERFWSRSSCCHHSLVATRWTKCLTLWLMGASWLMLGCRPPATETRPPRPVRAIRISDIPTLMTRNFPGTIAAVDAVELSFRVDGPLINFPANQLGKEFSRGELLAEIDPRDFNTRLRDTQAALARSESELEAMRVARPEELESLRAQLDRARAAAEFARAEFRRNESLRASGAVSLSEVEMSEARAKLSEAQVRQAEEALRMGEVGARPEDIRAKEAQIDSLQAALQTARDALEDTRLVAPFDGVVAATFVQNFEMVRAKQRILRLINRGEYEIRVDVPENLIGFVPEVEEGMVTVQSHPDNPIPATISEIGTEASPTTRTFPVKLRFTPPEGMRIRPGMTGIVTGKQPADTDQPTPGHVVPTSAVFQREQQQFAWLFDPDTNLVRARPVTILRTTPFGILVEGLAAGEWIVTAGVHYLSEGQRVRLMEQPTETAAQ